MKGLRDFVHNPPDKPFYAVIGHPVGHSLSPLIHNIALKHHGIDASYFALDTPLDSFAWIAELIRLPGFRGLNVTIPHKSRIMEPLDSIDPVAQETGAVNTVQSHKNGLIGYNTDVSGFEESLKPHGLLITGRKAVILGSGGAARAAAASLRKLKVPEAVIISRNPQARSWPERINQVPVRLAGYEKLQPEIHEAGLVINTTPAGMHPNVDDSPVPDTVAEVLIGKVCMDAIYNPFTTRFMKQAEDAGAKKVVGGLTMFTAQAAASFRIWTEKTFPEEQARQAVIEALHQNK